MHLVHHPQLHHRILVVIDGLSSSPMATLTPAARNGTTGVMPCGMWKSARMASDGDVPAPHQPYLASVT